MARRCIPSSRARSVRTSTLCCRAPGFAGLSSHPCGSARPGTEARSSPRFRRVKTLSRPAATVRTPLGESAHGSTGTRARIRPARIGVDPHVRRPRNGVHHLRASLHSILTPSCDHHPVDTVTASFHGRRQQLKLRSMVVQVPCLIKPTRRSSTGRSIRRARTPPSRSPSTSPNYEGSPRRNCQRCTTA